MSAQVEVQRALDHVDAASPSARCALDVALLDLIAQRKGVPLHVLLGGAPTGTVALSALLPMGDLDAALEFAEERWRQGISVFKAKVGADLDRELVFLHAFRTQFEHPFTLRLDANRTLAEQTASRDLARLAELEPEYLEEPFPLEALFRLKQPPPLPLALDESLQESDAELWAARAMDAGLVRALVLKPAALGGILRCLRLGQIGARRGVASSVSHLYDGPVALAAGAELALALERPGTAGLAPHPGLALWPAAVSPAIRGSHLERHDLPGLGLPPLELA
ncbi:MAG: O-succinylbenzoate synthase [Polyangiaceae bacterium]|nr:O-succinylbenzoate synthase [Polyangiaceae bacterium]